MSESKKPITRTRQEVKNIDIDETKYVKKEDQYAYGINTFTTENDTLTAMEIVSKDKGTTANVKLNKPLFTTTVPTSTNYTYTKNLYTTTTTNSKYINRDYFQLQITNTDYRIYFNNIDLNIETSLTVASKGGFVYTSWGNTVALCKSYLPYRGGSHYFVLNTTYKDLIFSYQHTLNISKGNEFEGLIIKFTEKPTNETSVAITTPTLFINKINYIKDVVGFILKEGVVTPYVFTYKDDVLYLNGTEIDVNSLTITDEVVTL